ncbi:MAG: glutathione transferase GstA [Burkholderiaceae bacterium]|nr:glutathione transferase GstA [Burkholderiaceae bacterium]
MKLYYSPGASSLATHISLREADLPFEMERVDLREKKTESGKDFYQVNPKGAVPALQLDNGEVLTEGCAVLQYVADLAPEKKLAPAAGSMARYRLMEWLNLIATELHKNFSPFFNKAMLDPCKEVFKGNLNRYLAVVEKQLSSTSFLMGDTFTVADAYLFTVSRYCRFAGVDMDKYPSLQAFQQRVAARETVKEALKFEGL